MDWDKMRDRDISASAMLRVAHEAEYSCKSRSLDEIRDRVGELVYGTCAKTEADIIEQNKKAMEAVI